MVLIKLPCEVFANLIACIVFTHVNAIEFLSIFADDHVLLPTDMLKPSSMHSIVLPSAVKLSRALDMENTVAITLGLIMNTNVPLIILVS